MRARSVIIVLGLLAANPCAAWVPHGGASSGAIPPPVLGPLNLLAVEDGYQSGPWTLGGDGTFTGTAPASMTATISGCGGGALAVSGLVTPSYGMGTYQVQFAMPTAAGVGCTITVTDNQGRTATSPPFKVLSTTPGSTVTANIHNAPGWLASHAYTPATGPKTRVLNGAGWTGSAFVPGALLNAYELTSSACTSAPSGGPSGTGASISDGTCTWKYLSGVDYITVSGWGFDAPPWVSGTTYTYFQTMTVNDGGTLRAYQLDGSGPTAFCTSAVAPSGVGTPGGAWSTGLQTGADGCTWGYLADITYSSRVASIPVASYVNNGWRATAHLDRPYTALLWNDAEYVAGGGGERNPIGLANHLGNGLATEGDAQGSGTTLTVMAAPGEGIASGLTSSMPLTGYDPTKGVALRNSTALNSSFYAALGFGFGQAGFYTWDFSANVTGLQMKSDTGPGLFGFNGNTFVGNIIDGGWNNGSWNMAVWLDNIAIFADNLLFSHGGIAIGAKYGNTFILHNTIINAGSIPDAVAIAYGWTWVFQDIVAADNAISGFAHVAAEHQGSGPSPLNAASIGNVTDTASPDTGTSWWVDSTTPTVSNVVAVPGTTYGVSAASMFVSPGSDYRPNTGLNASGAAFGPFYTNCWSGITCTPFYQTFDTPDILGNPRPNGAGQWSTGVEQHP